MSILSVERFLTLAFGHNCEIYATYDRVIANCVREISYFFTCDAGKFNNRNDNSWNQTACFSSLQTEFWKLLQQESRVMCMTPAQQEDVGISCRHENAYIVGLGSFNPRIRTGHLLAA